MLQAETLVCAQALRQVGSKLKRNFDGRVIGEVVGWEREVKPCRAYKAMVKTGLYSE